MSLNHICVTSEHAQAHAHAPLHMHIGETVLDVRPVRRFDGRGEAQVSPHGEVGDQHQRQGSHDGSLTGNTACNK
jgi:hypothetical protein